MGLCRAPVLPASSSILPHDFSSHPLDGTGSEKPLTRVTDHFTVRIVKICFENNNAFFCQITDLSLDYPEDVGGSGLGVMENVLVIEEFCKADSGVGMAIHLAYLPAKIVKIFGTPDQRRKFLSPLVKGDWVSAVSFTEPNHGSDITTMDTTAVRDGDSWVLNGTKTFITNGCIADCFITLCQTDPGVRPGYRGQSLILVEKGAAGLEAAEVGDKMGIRMTSTAEVSYTSVRASAASLVGEENRGFYHVLEFFDESRILVAAQALGIAQGAFDRALAYVKERRQFGRRIADFQVTQHKLADMATKIELARLMTYKAAWNYD